MPKTLLQRIEEGQYYQKAIDNTIRCDQRFHFRIKQRIERILCEPYPYFITFTLSAYEEGQPTDKIIKAIKKALSGAEGWLFNEDYGTENGRLHYHAVAGFTEQLDYTTFISKYQYGAVNIRSIVKKDEKSLREYLLKVTAHSIKQTAGKIYRSRKRRVLYEI